MGEGPGINGDCDTQGTKLTTQVGRPAKPPRMAGIQVQPNVALVQLLEHVRDALLAL